MPSRRITGARYGYAIAAGLFFVGVLAQTYIAGMAVFIDPSHWELHTTFVHLIEILFIPLLVFGFLARFSRRLKGAPVVLFFLIGVQYMTAEAFGSLVAAIHPVSAVVIALLTLWMAKEAWEQRDAPA